MCFQFPKKVRYFNKYIIVTIVTYIGCFLWPLFKVKIVDRYKLEQVNLDNRSAVGFYVIQKYNGTF